MAKSHVTWLKLEKKMKKILLAAAFSLAATSLSAGSMATPESGAPMLILVALLIAIGVSAK